MKANYGLYITKKVDITLGLRIKRFFANLLLSPAIHIKYIAKQYRRFEVNDKGEPIGYKRLTRGLSK